MPVSYILSSLACLLAGNALSGYAMVIIANKYIGKEIEVGVIFFINFLPILFIYKYLEKAIRSIGARNLLIFSLYGYSVTPLVLYFIIDLQFMVDNALWVLMVLAFFNGISMAASQSSRMAMIGDISHEKNQISLQQILSLIIIFSFASAPILYETCASYLGEALTFGFIALLFWVFALLLLKYDNVKTTIENRHFHDVTLTTTLKRLLGCSAVALSVLGLVQVVIPLYLSNQLEVIGTERALYLSCFGVGLFSGGIIAKLLWSPSIQYKVMIVSSVVSVTTLWLMATLTTYLLPLLFILGCAGGVTFSIISALIQSEATSHQKATMSTSYTLVFNLSPAFFGILSSLIYKSSSFTTTLFLFSILGVVTIFLIVRITESKKQNERYREDYGIL